SIRINDNDLLLRNGTDANHGLGWYGPAANKPFTGFSGDGPVLYGYGGGALGTVNNSVKKTALTWSSNGNVGIGTNTPQNKLDVEGGVVIGSIYAGNSIFSAPTDGAIIQGRVGIGTNNPSHAQLEVGGFVTTDIGDFGWLNGDGDTNFANGGLSYGYSIYASNRIAADEFNAFSDRRIKNILGRSNNQEDLATLLAIEITDYQHIDTIQKGTQQHKKVIAQQVAEVFPQAVTNNIREVIPDIYQRAEVNNTWIQLSTNLQVGDRVKLITANSKDIHEVTAVEANRFQVDELKVEDQEMVFVYGREVDDFHTVDYEAISMLNVSATQAQQERIEALEAENTRLHREINQLKDLESRFATLEALLNVPDAPASLNNSSTKK
ncbi:MAG: tail fiber domain-containing protein, partial [Bacteroidota bacterium]